MKRKLTKRLTALLLSALTVISALPFLGWGMRVRAAEGSTAATAAGEEFMRIFHLDCGRKYFSVDEIKGIIDQLSANHYTHLQLAFGNDGFRFLLDDMSVGSHSSDGVKTAIQSANTSYSNGKSTSSAILSQTDMDAITAYAKAKGIGIIPLLNTPGHMTALLDAMKSLDSSISSEMNINQGSGSYFDPQTCTAAADLTKELVSKYARYFADKGSKYFNLGADECGFGSMTTEKYAGFVNYINDLNAIVKGNGMTSLAFNDGFCRTVLSTSAKIDTDVLVCYWTDGTGYASTTELSQAGYKIINTNNDWYYVLGDYLYEAWGANGQWGYSNSKKALQTVPVTQVKDKSSVTPVGSMLCLWCDGPHKDYSESRDNVYDLIKTMADSNPAYFKAPELPEQTLTDSSTGISVTLTPSVSAEVIEYNLTIDISISISGKTASMTLDVTITENGAPFTNGAVLKIPYDTWNSRLSEYGFGIDKIDTLTGNVGTTESDVVDVKKDDENSVLVCTVPHFSEVEINATVEEGTGVELITKEITLDIGGTSETFTVTGKNYAVGGSDYQGPYVFNPDGVASVTITGKDAVEEVVDITYPPATVTCNMLISSDSNSWKAASGYYYKVGENYYPVYAKRSSRGFLLWYTYTYTWGYSTTDNDNSVTQITTQETDSTSETPQIEVYTKESTITTPAENAQTTITFKGVSAGTTTVTIGDTVYTIKVKRTPITVRYECVCDGTVLKTGTVEATDNLNGGYDYTIIPPSISGYAYSSGTLTGTVTETTTVTLTYVENPLPIDDYIEIPITIVDYRADGLLFDYSPWDESAAYSLLHTNGKINETISDAESAISGTTIVGLTLADNASERDYNFPASSAAFVRRGLVETTLGSNGMPVYTDAAIQFVAGKLANGIISNNAATNWNNVIYDTFLSGSASRSVIGTATTEFSDSFGNSKTYANIANAYDLAWYLLNTLYIGDTNTVTVTDNNDTSKTYELPIYGMVDNTYEKLLLVKDTTDGSYYLKAYTDTNRIVFDEANKVIYNGTTSDGSKFFYPLSGKGYDAYLGDTTDKQTGGDAPNYPATGVNGNYTLRGEAQFIYHERNNLYFEFTGDDDVYLFINGVLVLDMGAAHWSLKDRVDLNDVASQCGLKEGEVATFTFFYMERFSDCSNFGIRTNLQLVERSIDVEKKAYTANNDTEVTSGSAVSSDIGLIYDLIVRNNGNTDMTNFVFADTDAFGNSVYFGGTQTNTIGNGKAKLSADGPFTVWIANSATGETVGERITKSTAADVTAYLATLTLAPGQELHVKGLKGTFTPGTNSVFTYKNTLTVSASAGGQTLSDTAQHEIYSYDIGDTTRAYVVDFGLPVMLGNLFENVTAADFVTGVTLGNNSLKYGTASLSGSGADCTLTYTLTSAISGAEAIVLDVELNIHGTKLSSKKYITIVPATTVYYEDNFSDFVAFAGNGCEWTVDGTPESKQQHADRIGASESNVYGYDDAYAAMSKFSLGSAHKVTVSGSNYATAKFSFYGTGFDVISATTNTSGTIVVSVTGENGYSKNYLVDTYYGYKYVNGEWKVVADAAKALWQIPVMKVANLDYGKYDVTITVAYADFFSHGQNGGGSYDFWLDAVRIYDPAGAVAGAAGGSQENYENAYKADGECWPTYVELRDMIIRDKSFAVDSAANGMIFIDGQTGNVSMADYTSYGPNNELYLANGQAVAFRLNAAGNVADIQIALKNIVEGKNASCKIFAVGSEPENGTVLATATDMYRSIKDLNGKTVVIMNVGDADSILSITNLKTTYSVKPVATDTLNLTMDEKSALAALSAVDEVLNPKTPFEPGKVDVKVEDKDITVITSPDVDGIEIDGEKVTDFTVDSETGNRIWKKPIDRILKDNPEISVVARDSNGNVSAPVTAPVVAGGSIGALIGGFIGRLIKNILSVLFG